ncbi:poly-beta-1,6 N-acetyl-D-glucosamine export porin PgaA [Piscirickettsia salmonis]|uniref:hypothetical protein n=1 Tax=Piscirickettsia salmonis TaxID=1238 RepID=UPI001E380FC0|nr:hypothetical protein [Piscirickettsia salmonis]QGP51780.1 poly-beta-1,6 N-acetyl-D-glucosamine export porin PgaA [Piscirickettsia salmonis]QGP52977.1 poly-beta-1,6 N-acetyl-D-glucosamine export porin PgaA [Piscirickettsia salmonis]QGP61092.1 poly-beta-1,6 N-acetyl-D-glucosamine export porin PgaA [Piscirickettsia salmonis]QGP62549.1 poly-beta-1,6 N-acetyl-D-glucosamine export porin PgaA [Piscirickettsia salmonis]
MKYFHYSILIISSVLLSACGGGINTQTNSMPASVGAVDGVSPTVLAEGPAAILKQQAQRQLAAGELNDANSSLERALRFAPQDAGVWYEFALVRKAQKRPAEAVQMLKKATVYAGGNKKLQERIARLEAELQPRQVARPQPTS